MKINVYPLVFVILISLAFLVPIACAESSTGSFITIDPIGNHTVGEVFFINGTTNLPVSENLSMDIIEYYWFERPKSKNDPDHPPHGEYAYNIPVISIGSTTPGTNRWSVNVTDTVKKLVSGEYIVWVLYSHKNISCNTPGCLAPEAATNDVFTLFPAINGTTSNVQQITVQSTSPIQPTTSAVAVSSMKQSTPLPLVSPIAVLTAIVILRHIYGKKGD